MNIKDRVRRFTGGNDGRNQIAIRQGFDGRLSGVKGRAVHVIRRAANIVTATHSAAARGAPAVMGRRRETVTGRRVGAHVAVVTGISVIEINKFLFFKRNKIYKRERERDK